MGLGIGECSLSPPFSPTEKQFKARLQRRQQSVTGDGVQINSSHAAASTFWPSPACCQSTRNHVTTPPLPLQTAIPLGVMAHWCQSHILCFHPSVLFFLLLFIFIKHRSDFRWKNVNDCRIFTNVILKLCLEKEIVIIKSPQFGVQSGYIF